ncbi:Por secretion system C-terminal sorting domain-containing protein [Saccharicrinis carchari]|uniref:Por secretion system C-terminal sorting domain-containing protein n=1 Tax=Saccharicrinis carchari TaxID=1168039 RepID=A0A521DUE5_SACCC|nr:T9SS type A sorting domain-containing protein [Saccharicrinis carchari]SMO75353.1 Por secretion system C-terminal sorting domain-containing protein [Saccharicrinis carchari]
MKSKFMNKRFYITLTTILVLAGFYFVFHYNTHQKAEKRHLKPLASTEILQQRINKKIERRKNGYAKPDKPDKYVEYLQSLVSGYGKQNYGANHKINALKSAVARRASLKSAKVSLPWQQRGPGNVGGRTRCIIVDPDDTTGKTWFAGAVSGGIWKTTDAGSSWEIISPDLPNLATVSLCMAPSNSQVIYAGTGEGYYNIDAVRGNGIFKSTDKGTTWTQLASTKDKYGFHYVNSLTISHSNENILWAATNSGLVKSTDGGTSWYSLGAPLNQRYQKIIKHPNSDNILWATANDIGIYKTENGGVNWFLVHDMSGAGRIEITVAKKEPEKLYAIDEESNVYYSYDGGTEWASATESGDATRFLEGQGWYNSVMAVNPTHASKGFIGGIDLFSFEVGNEIAFTGRQAFNVKNNMSSLLQFGYFGGTYSNGGVTILAEYTNQTNNISIQFGTDKSQKCHLLKRKTTENSWSGLFAEDMNKLEYGGYVSVPFMVTNTSTGEQLHASFVDDNNNNKFDVYQDGYEVILIHNVAYNATAQNTFIQTNNGDYKTMAALYPTLIEGAVWNDSNLPEGDLSIESYSLKDRRLSSTRISNWWAETDQPNYSHADHHDITIIENSGNPFSVIVGNDGGIGYSSDGGSTWSSKSNGYITSQYYGITRHPKQYRYFGGLQDNGSTLSGNDPDKMSEWKDVLGGDGFDVVWHTRDPQMIIGTYYYNQLRKSYDGGLSWLNIGALMGDNDDSETSPFVTRIASSQADPDLLFTGGASGLWKSTNFGDSWKNINMGAHWGFTSNSSPKITISQANPSIVWAGIHMNTDPLYNTGKLHVSTDGGESFTALEPFMDMGPLSNLITHPTEPETAYMLFSFSNYPKIFRTEDLGQTWEDITGFGIEGSDQSSNGFPDVAINTMVVMPFDTNQLWVGTEIGLFISSDNGNTWEYADNGIPAVSIWDMKIIGDEVILGTHGLGVWTVKMDGLANTLPHPHINMAGIRPNGSLVLNTTFESRLDSFELYNNNGLLTTVYNITPHNKSDINFGLMESSDILYIHGYLNGQQYISNTVNLSPGSVYTAQKNYVNDFSEEDRINDFTGYGFSIHDGYFNNPAIHSPHPYPENTDLYYTLKYPIIVSDNPELAYIKYYDIAYLETGESGAVYPSVDFYDYAIMEGSKDGLNWHALSDGYDFSYNAAWSSAGKTYESNPAAKDYTNHHIDLYDTFTADDTILVRFRLHSDHFTAGWGWSIDNVRIQGTLSSVNDDLATTFAIDLFPNPVTNNHVNLRITDVYIGSVDVGIYTVSGQEISKHSYFKGTEVYEQQINIPRVSKGIYLVKIQMNNQEKTEKIRIH